MANLNETKYIQTVKEKHIRFALNKLNMTFNSKNPPPINIRASVAVRGT